MLISMVPSALNTNKAKFIFEVYLIDRGYKNILKEYEELSINEIANRMGKDKSNLTVIDLINYISNKSDDREFLYNALLDYLIIYISENSMNNVIYNYSKSQKVADMIKDVLGNKKIFPSDAGIAAIHLDFTEVVFTTYRNKFQDKDSALSYLAHAFINYYMNSNMDFIKRNSDKKSDTLQSISGDEFSIFDKVKTDELDKKEPNFNISFRDDVKIIHDASKLFGYGGADARGENFVYDIFSAYKYMYAEKRFKRFIKYCSKYFIIKPSLFMGFYDVNFAIEKDPNSFFQRNYKLRKKFISIVLNFPDDLPFETRFNLLYQNGENTELIKQNTTDIFGDTNTKKLTLAEKKERIWCIFKGMKCSEHFINNLLYNNIDPLCINSAMFRNKTWFKYNSNLEMYINRFNLLERAVKEEDRTGNGDIVFDKEFLAEMYKNKNSILASHANQSLLIENDKVKQGLLSYIKTITGSKDFKKNIKTGHENMVNRFYIFMDNLDKLNTFCSSFENTKYLMFKDLDYNSYIGEGIEFSKYIFKVFDINPSRGVNQVIYSITPKEDTENNFMKCFKNVMFMIQRYWLNEIAAPYHYPIDGNHFLFDGIRALSLCAFINCNIALMYDKLIFATSKMEVIDIFNRFKGFINLFEKTPTLKEIKLCDYYKDINLTKEEAVLKFGDYTITRFRVRDEYENGIVETCTNLAENGISQNENAIMDSIIRPIFAHYKGYMQIIYDIKKLVEDETYMFDTSFSTKNVNRDRLKEISDALIFYPYSTTINDVKVKYLDIQDDLGYYKYRDGELVTSKQGNDIFYLHKKGYWVCPELGLDDLRHF